MKKTIAALSLLIAGTTVAIANPLIPEKNEPLPQQTGIDGYKDTPMMPDGKWHIHDPERPQPPVAEPKYDGNPVAAPEGAIIIFDAEKGVNETVNDTWKVENGYITVGKGSLKTKTAFGNMKLHLEFRIPESCVNGWGQKQGNSGIFLMDKYEVQLLNCWGNRTYPDGMSGALYGMTPPLFNACRKPGEWQSYDIDFTAPVFKDGDAVQKARVTVYLNGVKVQDASEFTGASTWRKTPKYEPHPEKMPLSLQAHGNAIQFRNIWIVEK